jgi:hypothetical protein
MWFKLPEGHTSVSIGGIEYGVDEEGVFEVPDELGDQVLKEIPGVVRVAGTGPAPMEIDPNLPGGQVQEPGAAEPAVDPNAPTQQPKDPV